VTGVSITDRDADGLDDDWEQRAFGSLNLGPRDDPDLDGFSNAREQVMATDPMAANAPLRLELAELSPGRWRFSWPGREGENYRLQSGTDLDLPWVDLGAVTGRLPVAENVVPRPTEARRFYRVSIEGQR